MNTLISQALKIDEVDLRQVLVGFSFSFITAASYVTTRTVADSIFLSRLGPEYLPWMIIASALTVAATAAGYSHLAQRWRLPRAVRVTFLSLAAISLGLRALVGDDRIIFIVVAFVYVFAEVRGSLNTIQFSLLVNELFTSRDPKKVIGVIGVGATLAGVLFGFLVGYEAAVIGTENLLFMIAALDLLAIVPVQLGRKLLLTRTERSRRYQRGRQITFKMTPLASLRAMAQSPYARNIAAMVFLGVLVATFVQFQWKSVASVRFDDAEDRLTSYFGWFYGAQFLLIGIVQIFFTSRVMRGIGLPLTLMIYPGAILSATAGILSSASELALFWTVTITKGSDVFRRTMYDPAVQMLFWPMNSVAQRRLIPLVIGLVKPLSEAAAGLLLLQIVWFVSLRQLSLFVLVFVVCWLWSAWRCRSGYLDSLSESIGAGKVSLTGGSLPDDVIAFKQLEQALASSDEAVVANALELIASYKTKDWAPLVTPHLSAPSPRIRRLALEHVSTESPADPELLVPLFEDADLEIRLKAVVAYCRLKGPSARDLIEPLSRSDDARVAIAAQIGLLQSGSWSPEHVPLEELRRQAQSTDSAVRLASLELLTLLAAPPNRELWVRLFQDEDWEVARAAFRRAGQRRAPELLDPLLEQLENPHTVGLAVDALASYREDAFPVIIETFEDSNSSPLRRQELAKVLRRIASQQSVDIVLAYLNDPDDSVHVQLVHSLRRLLAGGGFKIKNAAQRKLMRCFDRDVRRFCARIADLADAERELGEGLLTQALRDELVKLRHGVLQLLACLYPGHEFDMVEEGLASNEPREQMLALELLLNVSAVELMPAIQAVFDASGSTMQRCTRCERFFQRRRRGRDVLLETLSADDSDWIQALALHFIGAHKLGSLTDAVRAALGRPGYLIRETALTVLQDLVSTEEFRGVLDRAKAGKDIRLARFAQAQAKE